LPSEELTDRIADLLESRLPLTVQTDGSQDDWNVIGLALLAASVRHLRVLRQLQAEVPSGIVGWQILRALFEYVTTFAWIASEPDVRARRWLKSDFEQRLKLHNDLASLGEELLEQGVREEFESYEPELPALPAVPERTSAADEEWQATIQELDDRLPEDFRRFRLLYSLIYRNGSRFVHPTTHGVNLFIEKNPPEVAIAGERPLQRDLVLIGNGLVALGLVIGSAAVPSLELEVEEVRQALA
jgi:hypothetical protein